MDASERLVRRLTDDEIAQARRVFGDSIAYARVRIVRARGPLRLITGRRTAVSTGFVIFVPPGATFDMPWLVHELAHTWQVQHHGWLFAWSKAVASHLAGSATYEYGGPEGLAEALRRGRHFDRFGVEQQAQIVEDYYRQLIDGGDVTPYLPYIEFVRNRGNAALT